MKPTSPRGRGAAWAVTGLALALAAGCGRTEATAPVRAPSALDTEQSASEAAYLAPPSVTAVGQLPGGALEVQGRAPPGAAVQFSAPDGEHARAEADARGDWRLRLERAAQPRLYAISAQASGRALHAEGALLLAPGSLAPAVMLRAGSAALPLVTRQDGLDIATVDYDPSGFLAAAGDAPAGAGVSLMVDGGAAAGGRADGQGRYTLLAAGRRLALGDHRLSVDAGGRRATREVTLTAAQSLTTPFAADRLAGGGWRVEWALTGGGVQTTLLPSP